MLLQVKEITWIVVKVPLDEGKQTQGQGKLNYGTVNDLTMIGEFDDLTGDTRRLE
jgi:hypothetical protein